MKTKFTNITQQRQFKVSDVEFQNLWNLNTKSKAMIIIWEEKQSDLAH